MLPADGGYFFDYYDDEDEATQVCELIEHSHNQDGKVEGAYATADGTATVKFRIHTAPKFQIHRSGTISAFVIAGTKADAQAGMMDLEQRLGRPLIWRGPTFKRTLAHWEANAVVSPEDPV